MKKRKRKNCRGFTIIELITVIALSGIIVGLLARFVVQGMDTYHFVDDRKTLLRDARLAVHFMNRDFRQVKADAGIQNATATQFRFTNYDEDDITYQYADNKITRNGYTLADHLTSFQLRYLRADDGYMTLPVTSDSLAYIWNVEAEFTISADDHSRRMLVKVYPRKY